MASCVIRYPARHRELKCRATMTVIMSAIMMVVMMMMMMVMVMMMMMMVVMVMMMLWYDYCDDGGLTMKCLM